MLTGRRRARATISLMAVAGRIVTPGIPEMVSGFRGFRRWSCLSEGQSVETTLANMVRISDFGIQRPLRR
jgi:hypothetical protein